MRLIGCFAMCCLGIVLAACGPRAQGASSCEGVDCAAHGQCIEADGQASCRCEAGFESRGLTCTATAAGADAGAAGGSGAGGAGTGGRDGGAAGNAGTGGAAGASGTDGSAEPQFGPPTPCDVSPALCTAAHASNPPLVTANGFGAVVWDTAAHKVSALWEHVYRDWDEGVPSRNLLFDSFVGVRAGGRNVWLNTMPPAEVGYARAGGIIRVVHRLGDLRVETFVYAPWELARPAVVLLARATNLGDAAQRVSLYTLHNYHLGFTTMADRVRPDAEGERLVYRADRGAYVESGIGGTLVHQALGATSHHGATPDNPWEALRAGADLADTADSAVGSDRVAGFQQDLDLAAGQAGWIGVVSAFASGQDPAPALADLQAAFGARGPRAVLEFSLAEWESWRKPPPEGLSAGALAVWRQSEAVLRMGQVWETTDRSKGQIVASLPPGQWNITWARDMSYAMVALARSGHHAEAKAALAFVLGAESGRYTPMYVPVPYQVSITRYFGRGKEETDFDESGPNIEYDGFGLYLWALGEYVAASGDMAFLAEHWPAVQARVADALVGLVDPALGLIAADSSIWEVHWNGRQKHYTYTSIAAARGLCSAATLARLRGDAALATRYENAAMGLRDALLAHSVDPGGVLASSVEELRSGSGYHDMASTEAIGWSLLSPTGRVARATLAGLGGALAVASGRGFFRNDDGGWYDLQEWVFVDLRASVSQRRAGNAAEADRLLDWITAQALANAGLVAELQEPSTSAYEGAVPMVGFGAGGYLLAALERAHPQMAAPACGAWELVGQPWAGGSR